MQGKMWLRPRGTYARHVRDLLNTTRAFQFGGETIVMSLPPAAVVKQLQAKVANVARGILGYLEGELPDFSLQLRGRCFLLPAPIDDNNVERRTPRQNFKDLLELLLSIQWSRRDAEQCVAEYVEALPLALAEKMRSL